VGGNQVRKNCDLVLDALEKYMAEYDRPVEGQTLSDIAEMLRLKWLRGNNFTNAVKELKRYGDVLYSEEMRKESNREYRVITLSLPQS
jgi:hypothetical protein